MPPGGFFGVSRTGTGGWWGSSIWFLTLRGRGKRCYRRKRRQAASRPFYDCYRLLPLLCALEKWMTIFVRAYVSEPLLGIWSNRIAPSGFFLSSAPSTRSICAAFQTFNSYFVPVAPETSMVSSSCEGD